MNKFILLAIFIILCIIAVEKYNSINSQRYCSVLVNSMEDKKFFAPKDLQRATYTCQFETGVVGCIRNTIRQ